jgi:hypothetical protein
MESPLKQRVVSVTAPADTTRIVPDVPGYHCPATVKRLLVPTFVPTTFHLERETAPELEPRYGIEP